MVKSRITVVGAGVIGLTTAVRLVEAGYQVDVLARDMPRETTSAVAGALWYPHRANPPERVARWSAASLAVYTEDAADSKSGVHLVDGLELRKSRSTPWFADVLPDSVAFSHYTNLPDGYGDGWQMRLPVIEPAVYLEALIERLESGGGTLTRLAITGMPDRGIVVNCTGLAARSLVNDPSVQPVQGHVVRVKSVSGLDTWLLDQSDEDAPVYVIPRSRDVIVGGTAVEGCFDRRPDETIAKDVLRRATRLLPQLGHAEVLGTATGVRPARPQIRLEIEPVANGGAVIHNYGHGDCGWTLAWGCADSVVEHVDLHVAKHLGHTAADTSTQRATAGRPNDYVSVAWRVHQRGGQPSPRRRIQP